MQRFEASDDPIRLPAPEAPERPAPFPLLAAFSPVLLGVAFWAVSGSGYALLFAAFGPVVAIAAVGDRAWGSRRRRRRERRDRARARAAADAEIRVRHDAERRAREEESAHVSDTVRRGAPRASARVRVGVGVVPSEVRVEGDGEDARALRAAAGAIADAPVTVPAGRIHIVGEPVPARAVQRAVVLSLLAADAESYLAAAPPGWEWARGLERGAGPAIGIGEGPADAAADASARRRGGWEVRVLAREDDAAPDAVLLRMRGSGRGEGGPGLGDACDALGPRGERRALLARDVRFDALALAQARALAAALAEARAAREEEDPARGRIGRPGGLAVALGDDPRDRSVVDLVADGPHAAIVGVTGSGKSELLRTWIVRLCRAYSVAELTFLLADFKGGTAFEALRGLPHVGSVVSDLDPASAARAIGSLRAEIRRREGVLAAAGARDVDDLRAREPHALGAHALARLVIVVDEFAALRAEHAELASVFADVAARGRGLGMHLVLGTQRATGVLRDDLLANVPLRIGLRTIDEADSRLLLGGPEAAALTGGGRGLIRRAADPSPRALRIARRPDAAIAALADLGEETDARARPVWLPALPNHLDADGDLATRWGAGVRGVQAGAGDGGGAEAVPGEADGRGPGALVLGLADDPDRQRYAPWIFAPARDRALLVVGGPGSGRSAAVAAALRAHARAGRGAPVRVPRDPEAAWDALVTLGDDARGAGLVAIDDLDALLAALPDDYAQVAVGILGDLLRVAGDAGPAVVASALRSAGALARLAELFPVRLALAYPTRAEALAAGVPGDAYDPAAPPGRGFLLATGAARGAPRVVQVFAPGSGDVPPASTVSPESSASPASTASPAPETAAAWVPRPGVRIVARRPGPFAEAARAAGCDVLRPSDAGGAGAPAGDAGIVIGSPEEWQRHWGMLADAPARGGLVIEASCPGEYRALAADRALPPYTRPVPGAAWLLEGQRPPRRVRAVRQALPRGSRRALP